MAHDRQPTELDHAAQITPLNREWDHASGIDMPRLRHYRLGRTRAQLTNADVAGALLFDPSNMRYASGYRSGPLFQMHLPLRYLFVATDGPIVPFGERSIDLDTIAETRPSIHTHYMLAGPELDVRVAAWADEIADLVTTHGGGNRRLAIDRCEPRVLAALAARGVEVCDAQEWMEQARLIMDCVANRYMVLAHGVGLCDEFPAIYNPQDWETKGYEGDVVPGMVLCVESYIGPEGAREGVKLEQQVLVTDSGSQVLSRFPWDDALTG